MTLIPLALTAVLALGLSIGASAHARSVPACTHSGLAFLGEMVVPVPVCKPEAQVAPKPAERPSSGQPAAEASPASPPASPTQASATARTTVTTTAAIPAAPATSSR